MGEWGGRHSKVVALEGNLSEITSINSKNRTRTTALKKEKYEGDM